MVLARNHIITLLGQGREQGSIHTANPHSPWLPQPCFPHPTSPIPPPVPVPYPPRPRVPPMTPAHPTRSHPTSSRPSPPPISQSSLLPPPPTTQGQPRISAPDKGVGKSGLELPRIADEQREAARRKRHGRDVWPQADTSRSGHHAPRTFPGGPQMRPGVLNITAPTPLTTHQHPPPVPTLPPPNSPHPLLPPPPPQYLQQ
jgi:hypothetical protein